MWGGENTARVGVRLGKKQRNTVLWVKDVSGSFQSDLRLSTMNVWEIAHATQTTSSCELVNFVKCLLFLWLRCVYTPAVEPESVLLFHWPWMNRGSLELTERCKATLAGELEAFGCWTSAAVVCCQATLARIHQKRVIVNISGRLLC